MDSQDKKISVGDFYLYAGKRLIFKEIFNEFRADFSNARAL
jgi:hypothetical protein